MWLLGAACLCDYAIAAYLPRWFIEMAVAAESESPIHLFEIDAAFLAARFVYFHLGREARTCVLRVGEKAALAALEKGTSSSQMRSILINVFFSLAARSPIIWRFEYVNTKASAAGPPSRDCGDPPGAVRNRASVVIPPTFARVFSSRGALCM